MKFTSNYDQFLRIDANREVNKSHVKTLAESIKEQNLLEANPIIVNSDMEIIDGQHRLEACRLLHIPVPYVVVDNHTSIGTIIRLQVTQRGWKMADYIHAHMAMGKEHYGVILSLSKQYSVPVGTAAYVLSGGGRSTSEKVRNGTFQISNLKVAIKTFELMKLIKPFIEKNVPTDRRVYIVVYRLLLEGKIKEARFIKKFSICPNKLMRLASEQSYLREIENIYNYHAQDSVRLF